MERFDAAGALDALERYAVTHSQWVPTMFIRMLRLDDAERLGHDLSAHRVAIHSAAPCPTDVKEQMIAWWGPIIHEYYSGSEGNVFVAIDSPGWLAHRGSVGRAVFGELHILDEDGRELPPGQVGSIYVARSGRFVYHNDPEKTAASRNAAGWTTLGDIGWLDADGFLYLADRRSDLIISGGVNIYPQEIENVLAMHPAVHDCAVIGVPDAEFGQRVRAVVELDPGVDPDDELAEELLMFCRERLSGFKCPREVVFDSELPRTETGKLSRQGLRDRPAG
jgi:acyl-CoA synthetase (AMP-forming)/AMP-acid ligase II